MAYVLSARMKNVEIYLETCSSSQMIKIDGDYILTRPHHQQAQVRDFFVQILFLYQAL